MKDIYKTKKQLINELVELRHKIIKMELLEKKSKQTEKKLRESDERYRLFADSTSDMVYVKDDQLRYILVNKALLEFHGKKEDEIVGKTVFELLPEHAAEKCTETDKKVLEEDTFVVTEELIGDKFYETRKFPIKLTNNMKGIGGCIKDVTERKRAEEALRRKFEEQALLLDNIQTQIWYLTDFETHGIVNKACADFFGKKKEDLENKKLHDIMSKEEAETCIAGNKEIFEKKVTIHTEEQVINSQGEKRILAITKTPKLDELGNIEYVVCSAEDITEHKNAERKLRESEERYRLLFNNVSDAIFVHEISPDLSDSGKFRIIEVNDIACQYLGYSREELLQMNVLQIDDPETLAGVHTVLKKLFAEGRATWEGIHVSKDGRKIPVEISNQIFEFHGKTMVLAAIRDITERKQADKALRESEKHYRETLNAMGDWILVVDQDLKILLFNEAFMQINKALGLNTDLIGRTPMEIFPFFPQTLFDEYRWVFENKKILITEETTKVGDREFVTESRKIPLFQDGKVAMIVSVIRDISEKRHLEDRLQHAQKMEAVGTLAGGIAHDFNNILTAIIGFGNLLQEEIGEKEPFNKYMATILASARRAADLTQGLLAFSRTQIIYPRPVNLNEMVKGLKDFLSRLMGEAIELSMVLTKEDLTVIADSSQIELVLINFATNAIDAMPEGGSFIIRTERIQLDDDFIKAHKYGKPAPYALMTIEDTGQGMDEKTKERIFEPFFTTKEVGKGTGLGLSMSYGIIRQHDGYIDVYSEPGKGTTFKIYLPLIKSEGEKIRAEKHTYH
jgi:two-component system cell cycle sensor histidine kinase/response regulator CckA